MTPRCRARWLRAAALAPLLGAMGCVGLRVLEPMGPNAAEAERLWWVMLIATGFSAAVVIALILASVFVPRRHRDVGSDRRLSVTWILIGGLAFPLIVIVVLVVETARTGAAMVDTSSPPVVTVEVIGHRFWWELRYPEHDVVTANELHIPAGRTVRLRLSSADVIHSFWVPELAGKMDLLPDKVNELWIRADEPDVYRGFCTEFCGIQHAFMGFLAVASTPAEFGAWLEEQQQPVPETKVHDDGAAVFVAAGCHLCHVVRGATPPLAVQNPGPDLTHLGSRRTLAAATVENTPENLARFIRNPHWIKPGVLMPATPSLSDEDLEVLVDWLLRSR